MVELAYYNQVEEKERLLAFRWIHSTWLALHQMCIRGIELTWQKCLRNMEIELKRSDYFASFYTSLLSFVMAKQRL